MPPKRSYLLRRVFASYLKGKERLGFPTASSDGISWLLVATLPNAGSTALSELLFSGRRVTSVSSQGEGQWATFDMHKSANRWDPEADIDYRAMRLLSLERLAKRGERPILVVEKSPSNLVRMPAILDALSPMPTRVMRLTRDPYAVCVSWASRYGPKHIAQEWREPTEHIEPDSADFYQALGAICGKRMALLGALVSDRTLDIRYEDLTEDPVSVLAPLKEAEPLLDDVDPGARLRVKDYKPRPLENMNARQIGKLSQSQIASISAGLEPYADELRAFGYELR